MESADHEEPVSANKYQRKISANAEGMSDVYDVLHAFGVQSHAVGHAVKKLLMPGQRGAKDYAQDLREAVHAINRELERE
jgi:hypothetical protein